MTSRERFLWWACAGVFAAAVIMQAFPAARTNPPVETEAPATPEARAVLRRACYDCHSNETAWPWYSRVAPVSWLLARDVDDGRRHMNLSTWNRRSPEDQAKAFREAWEEVESGGMPLWFYVPLHSAARLSDADKAILRRWSESQGAR